MAETITIRGRIKVGATLMHDHSFHSWPDCSDGIVDANLVFDCTLHLRGDAKNSYWECRRPGFGIIGGDYGNGSLLVNGLTGVEPVDSTPSTRGVSE